MRTPGIPSVEDIVSHTRRHPATAPLPSNYGADRSYLPGTDYPAGWWMVRHKNGNLRMVLLARMQIMGDAIMEWDPEWGWAGVVRPQDIVWAVAYTADGRPA